MIKVLNVRATLSSGHAGGTQNNLGGWGYGGVRLSWIFSRTALCNLKFLLVQLKRPNHLFTANSVYDTHTNCLGNTTARQSHRDQHDTGERQEAINAFQEHLSRDYKPIPWQMAHRYGFRAVKVTVTAAHLNNATQERQA